jgi:hypothetical protein
MRWWRKVRRANIPDTLRDQLEQAGETVVAMMLASGITAQYSGPLVGVLQTQWEGALAWLTERRDIQERREDRLEMVEWAILIFVVVGVLADFAIVAHEWFRAN